MSGSPLAERPERIPYEQIGGSGPSLLFAHANGYPPGCYLPFFELFKPHYSLKAIRQRPLWPGLAPETLEDWHPLAGDLLAFLDQQSDQAVIAVGHSLGGVTTLRAALRSPDRFRAIVLLDPVLLPPAVIFTWRLIRSLGLSSTLHPLISVTLTRRREFDDLEQAYKGYRRRDIFQRFSDDSLRAYLAGITAPLPGGGYGLVYSPEWEARIYHTGIWSDMDIWRGLPSLEVPTLILHGAESDTFRAGTGRLVRKKNPAVRVEAVPQCGHLLPLERPVEVFELIHQFLQETL